jgi:ATP-dependent exoDNAse (exonuclease V) beta subunit
VNGWKEEERKKDILYTAVTRARDVLVICGSKEDYTGWWKRVLQKA